MPQVAVHTSLADIIAHSDNAIEQSLQEEQYPRIHTTPEYF